MKMQNAIIIGHSPVSIGRGFENSDDVKIMYKKLVENLTKFYILCIEEIGLLQGKARFKSLLINIQKELEKVEEISKDILDIYEITNLSKNVITFIDEEKIFIGNLIESFKINEGDNDQVQELMSELTLYASQKLANLNIQCTSVKSLETKIEMDVSRILTMPPGSIRTCCCNHTSSH